MTWHRLCPRGPGGRPGGWVVEVVEVCRTVGDVALDVAPRGRRTMRFFCIEIRLLAHSHGEVRQCVVQMQASVRLLTLVRAACSASWHSRYLPQAPTVFGTCSSRGPRVASRKMHPLPASHPCTESTLSTFPAPRSTANSCVVNARQKASGLGAFRRPFHRGDASAAACSHGHACPARQRRAIAQGNKLSASRPCLPARALRCW